MTTRNTVAQVGVLAALALAGCSGSHGRSEDAGARGADATAPDAGTAELDAALVHDGGRPGPCAADDARAEICPAATCDGPPSWHWNGDDCFPIECGACVGADCARGRTSEAQCLAEHASCEPARCRATGGEWRWWAEDCGHFACGYAPPEICEVGTPSCDCGAFRSFDPERGCFDDATCPIPEPVTREALCVATGGAWEGICCDTVCGVPCAAACLAPACDCGPARVFEEARGCVESARCYEPQHGEICEGEARCAPGTICCQRCGGAGCFGPPTCETPVCDDDPDIDTCGNNLLAP